MPEVHRPELDDEDDSTDAARSRATTGEVRHRSKSFLKILLEVVLISMGVFLGLMGEQWREHTQHRKLAQESLERFRTEIGRNRAELVKDRDYRVKRQKELQTFLETDLPKTPKRFDEIVHITAGIGVFTLEHTAWDVAVATGSLAYVEPQLTFALSHVYTNQQGLMEQQRMIVQSTIYGRSWTVDFEGYFRSVSFYFNDIGILEPALARQYDDVLRQIDRALGPAAGEPGYGR